jgi:hypothetical protein
MALSRFVLPYADVGAGIRPSSGAKLFFYASGTSTFKSTFTDATGSTANTNPVIANANGVFPAIFLDGIFNIALKDSNDVQIYTADPVYSGSFTSPVFATVAAMVASSPVAIDGFNGNLSVGMFVSVVDYATGNNSGVLFGSIVAGGTGTADGGSYVDLANGNQWKQNFSRNGVSVKQFGAVGDGATNIKAVVQAIHDYLPSSGGIIKFDPGYTFYIGSSILITKSNITIEAKGSKITANHTLGPEAGNTPDGVFNLIGAASTYTTLSADAAENAETIVVSGSTGFAAGQPIFLYNATGGVGNLWYTEQSTTVFRSAHNRIKSISGTTIALMYSLPFSFDATTYTCTVSTWEGVQNFTIDGGDWDGGGYDHNLGNGEGTALLYSKDAQNITIKAERVAGFSGASLWLTRTHGINIDGGFYSGHRDDYTATIVEGSNSGFYGIRMDECSEAFVGNIAARRLRHTVDGIRSDYCKIYNMHTVYSHKAPYGSHNACNKWAFSNLTAEGDGGGILWRGFDCEVHGGFIDAPNSSIPAFYDTVGTASDLYRKYRITGLGAKTGRECLRLDANVDSCIIDSCEFDGAIESESYDVMSINTLRIKTLQVNGGILKATASFRLVDFSSSPEVRDSIQFNNVEFRGYTSTAIRCYSVSGETTLNVRGYFIAGDASTITVDAQGVYDNLSRKGFIKGGGVYNPEKSELLSSGKTVDTVESGKVYTLGSAGGFTVVLPVPADGLKFKFIVRTPPTTSYIIQTDSSANLFYGTINEITDTTGVSVQAQNTINFVASVSIRGDWVELESDGSYWYVNGCTQVNNGITTA